MRLAVTVRSSPSLATQNGSTCLRSPDLTLVAIACARDWTTFDWPVGTNAFFGGKVAKWPAVQPVGAEVYVSLFKALVALRRPQGHSVIRP